MFSVIFLGEIMKINFKLFFILFLIFLNVVLLEINVFGNLVLNVVIKFEFKGF